MKRSDKDIALHLLDFLVDGPESFAGLYTQLRKCYIYYSTVSTDSCLDALLNMEKWGWVDVRIMEDDGSMAKPTDAARKKSRTAYRQWLSAEENPNTVFDEIGLWYQISPIGREEWKKWAEEQGEMEDKKWEIDDSCEKKQMVVRAEDSETAKEAIQKYLSIYPKIKLIEESKRVTSVPEIKLRDGTIVKNGVQLVYEYCIVDEE